MDSALRTVTQPSRTSLVQEVTLKVDGDRGTLFINTRD